MIDINTIFFFCAMVAAIASFFVAVMAHQRINNIFDYVIRLHDKIFPLDACDKKEDKNAS